MTVKELINLLGLFPDDLQVILSRDSEGNGYSPLYDVEDAMYDVWDNEIYAKDSDIGTHGYTEEDRAPEGAKRVVVLWP